MEWHGGKMLPRGLPELVYEVTPNWILSNLKVIAYPRKRERGCGNGSVGWQDYWWQIDLYPTGILHEAKKHRSKYTLIPFRYWKLFLEIMLHEIGHIATFGKSMKTCMRRYWQDWHYREHVEWMADVWCEATKDKIATRDPRLGQPEGWIGGLPGIYLHRFKNTVKFDGKFDSYKWQVLQNYRAYQCGGQLSLTEVVNGFFSDYLPPPYYLSRRRSRLMTRRFRRKVKAIANTLAINRHYEDHSGRKHQFFNHGEYLAIVDELRKYILQNDLTEQVVKEFTGFDKKVKEATHTLANGKRGVADNKPKWFPGLITFDPLDRDDDMPF